MASADAHPVDRRPGRPIQPLGARRTRVVGALVALLAVVVGTTLTISLLATARAENKARIIQVSARQRTLVDHYFADVLMLRENQVADPTSSATLLRDSVATLLSGGDVPEVPGDDDGTTIPAVTDQVARRQLQQEQRLITDLTTCGTELMVWDRCIVTPSAGERLLAGSDVQRFRDLADLTSNVGLNATTTLADDSDDQVHSLIRLQVGLGAAALLVALPMGVLVVMAARRQVAHFRSLVQSSNDLVVVLDRHQRAAYVSPSVTRLLGQDEESLHGAGFLELVHEADRPLLADVREGNERLLLRCLDGQQRWRHLEATVTDLRHDRHVRGVVLACRDVTDRIDVERELAHAAFHDPLTGMANRAQLQLSTETALAAMTESGEPFAVLLLDLDNFKQVNDSLGHPVGDELLTIVSSRLDDLVRAGDTVARLGGDEFCLLLRDADAQVARHVATRVLQVLADPVVVEGRELFVSASVGIALPEPDETTTASDLFRRADVAMYAAKRSGPGQLEEYTASMDLSGLPIAQDAEIRAAVENGEFVLHYQPERDIRTGLLVGAEALLRWQHPTLGLLGPAAFLPTAEATTAIIALGEVVLVAACEQVARWHRDGLLPDGFTMWVNLSQRQLLESDLLTVVERSLRLAGLPAQRLGVEVTETALVSTEAGEMRVRANLDGLQRMGVRIAIDDFGTGFSSLAHIRGLPADVIKIDRSFVAGVCHQPKDIAIVGNVINLAHALGLLVIAEGVETEGQLAAVGAMSCDVAQGFLLGRPGTVEEMEEHLQLRTVLTG